MRAPIKGLSSLTPFRSALNIFLFSSITFTQCKQKILKEVLTFNKISGNISFALIDDSYGGIAQLGERLNGIQEVSGSIPLISTNLFFIEKIVLETKRSFS